ncbi:MAG: CinA family protein, partial [Bacteroidetes bacterium]|nr:CinA family protein [Bacteroidota bacterium]
MQNKLDEIIHKTHNFFAMSHLTLSVAESCTGGLICSFLTDIEGASSFFKGGIICYWTESKIDVLGVSPETITSYGAVSSETAVEMAEKIRQLFGTDYGVAITGNLGPTTIEGKEKGLVYIAASRKGQTDFLQLNLTGNRMDNKIAAALSALK